MGAVSNRSCFRAAKHFNAKGVLLPDFDFLHLTNGLQLRYARWKAGGTGNRGPLILLGGRTEFIEKYEETARDLTQRGFDVYSMDWRGQGLSSRELPDRRKGYVNRYEDYVQDLNAFVDEVIRTASGRSFSILAHSMGGHIAFRYLQQGGRPVERAVLVCSMIGIFSSPIMCRLVEWICSAACFFGLSTSYLPGQAAGDPEKQRFPGNLYTSDPKRFRRTMSQIRKQPELATGGATWAWLRASCRSVRQVQRPDGVEKIDVPVLFVGGGGDRVVSLPAQQNMANRIARGEFFRIQGARHEILIERDEFRSIFWRHFDEFMGIPVSG